MLFSRKIHNRLFPNWIFGVAHGAANNCMSKDEIISWLPVTVPIIYICVFLLLVLVVNYNPRKQQLNKTQ